MAKKVVRPNLLSFDFDRGLGLLTLHFDQVVWAKTLDLSKIKLQQAASVLSNGTAVTFTSTYNSLTLQKNASDIYFYMIPEDYFMLAIQDAVGTSASNTFLNIREGVCIHFA